MKDICICCGKEKEGEYGFPTDLPEENSIKRMDEFFCFECIEKEQKKEEWLNSKGHSFAKVKCEKCKKEFEAVIENVRREFALKNDTFYCQRCSKKMI